MTIYNYPPVTATVDPATIDHNSLLNTHNLTTAVLISVYFEFLFA